MTPIDQCSACGGRLRIISLSRDERIRRRVGQAMIAKCGQCGVEVSVVKDAWRRFMKDSRDARRKAEREKQPSLF